MSEPVAPNKPPKWLYEREEPDTRTPIWRLVLAWVVVALAVALAAVFIWAALDTRHYVVLAQYFGSLPTGAFLLLLLLTVAFFLGWRVITTTGRRRSLARTTLVILTVIAGIAAVFVYAVGWFRYSPTLVASSPDGRRHAVWIVRGGENTLRILVGSGLGEREIGNVGVICGRIDVDKIVFDGNDTLKVSTPYNDFVIPLDPDSGVPRKHFGARCDDPVQ